MLTSADMGSKGEIRVNQAKRGYDVAEDEAGLSWINPYVSTSLGVGLDVMLTSSCAGSI